MRGLVFFTNIKVNSFCKLCTFSLELCNKVYYNYIFRDLYVAIIYSAINTRVATERKKRQKMNSLMMLERIFIF
jgi:hypothetical protein